MVELPLRPWLSQRMEAGLWAKKGIAHGRGPKASVQLLDPVACWTASPVDPGLKHGDDGQSGRDGETAAHSALRGRPKARAQRL